MKKLLIIIGCILGIGAIASCGGDDKEVAPPKTTDPRVEVEVVETPSPAEDEYTEEDLYKEYPILEGSDLINEKSLKSCLENPSIRESLAKQAQINADVKAEEEANGWNIETYNCEKTAESYLEYSSFSRPGLANQLEFEGYSPESIELVMEKLDKGVDWNMQCASTAASYLEYSSFSRDGLANQLEFEGFTEDQIEYALSYVGY